MVQGIRYKVLVKSLCGLWSPTIINFKNKSRYKMKTKSLVWVFLKTMLSTEIDLDS